MPDATIRATVTLPAALVAAADEAIRAGLVSSRSELVRRAVARELLEMERRALDEAFAAMADDRDFQREARSIAAEFSASDWEALGADEGDR